MADIAKDRIALQDLMLRYAMAIDERDKALYVSCFSKDVEIVGFGSQSYRGIDAWLKYVWQALEQYQQTQHLLGPQWAEVIGDSAETRSDVQALHVLHKPEGQHLMLWGTYKSRMQRIDGVWKILRHELVVRATRQD